MPIYEYKCEECGNQLEQIQKFSDPPLQECPKCKGSLIKLLSSSSFHLKGSGWYSTGYSKNKEPSKEKSENKSSEKKTPEKKSSEKKSPEKKSPEKKSSATSSSD